MPEAELLDSSIFEELKPPELYGYPGLAIILYTSLVQLLAFVMGISILLDALDPLPHYSVPTLFAVGTYEAFATITGIILRGKIGLILSASSHYFFLCFFLLEIWPNFPSFVVTGACIPAISLALMHTYHYRRFYKLQKAGLLLPQHFISLLIGIAMAACMPHALGWHL